MPYGVDKDLGGDNEKNDKWMEKCVDSVMKSGKDKSSAVAICKAQMKKKHEKNSNLEFTEVDTEIVNWFEVTKNNYIHRLMDRGLTFDQASSQFEADLGKGKIFNL